MSLLSKTDIAALIAANKENKTTPAKAAGYIIHEDDLRVAIATVETKNAKTGNMVQVWILSKEDEPNKLVKSGKDDVVCGNCPLRAGNGCYVMTHQAPLSIYRSYLKGNYSSNYSEFLEVVSNRKVRFGAYGDPYFIPLNILQEIASACKSYTGYTHQWNNKDFNNDYLTILMASVDNQRQIRKLPTEAKYFRIIQDLEEMQPNENMCDNLLYGTSCSDCMKCSGLNESSIVVLAHGIKSKKIKTA